MKTVELELTGGIISADGAGAGDAGQDITLSAGSGNVTYGDGGNIILTAGAAVLSSGTQEVDVGGAKGGGDTPGPANDATVYTAAVVIDGGSPQPIAVTGSAIQTYTALLSELNTDTTGATWSLTNGNLLLTSDTTGLSSSVAITDTDLFSSLTDYVAINAAVPGAGSAGAVVITPTATPTVTTNKLYNVAGVLTWNGATLDTGGGGISAVVEDTTPQLGGALDGQGFAITDATFPATINAQVGVTYTAVLADADKIITLTNAAAIAMTIPANASVAYPIGTKLNFQQLGAGAVTVGITSDTLLINAGASLVLNGQNSIATALKITATSWMLFGQLVPAFPPLTSVAISDLDNGTDGELITWDASGVATTVPAGTATQVLTSNGAGAEPTFQTVGAAGSAANLATTGADVNVDLSAPPTTGQVLVATSATTSTWQTPAATGIANVVEDTTPQLGGALDVNGYSIISANAATPDTITLAAGDSTTATNGGGTISILGGVGNTTGQGGGVSITAGNGGVGSSSGGDLNLRSGDGGGYGGDILINAGDAVTDGDGGDIILTPGTETGGNSNGAVIIAATTAPLVTTNKLYNIAGALTWNGIDLTTSGVTIVGTPVNNQVAVWTGDGTLEGTTFIDVDPGGAGTVVVNAPTSFSVVNSNGLMFVQDNNTPYTGTPRLEFHGGASNGTVKGSVGFAGGAMNLTSNVSTVEIVAGLGNNGITLTPAGTGNVTLGTVTIDADQVLGAGQDNFVMTYDNGTGLVSLEAVGAAGSAANLATTGADVNVDLSAPPTTGQVLVATSATTSTWQTPAATGIANVVEDTTPQLGGQLDVNGNAIGDGTLELITFTETGSAVNQVNITNAATGTAPIIGAAGGDANVDISIQPKGTGDVVLGTVTIDGDQTIGAGQDNFVMTYDNGTGLVSLEAAGSAANLATTGADVNVDLSAPPTTGQVLVATSATTSTWQTPAATGIANVVVVTTTSATAAVRQATMVDDDTAGSTVTITLPAGSTNDQQTIKKLGTTANVIVDGDSAETIDGAATFTLTAQYASVTVIWNGTEWSII